MKNNEQQLGRLLVRAGKITQQDLQDLLAEQKKRKEGGESSLRLGEMMILSGMVTAQDVRGILEQQSKIISICTGCGARYNIPGFDSEKKYRCRKCRAELVAENSGDSVSVVDTKMVPTVHAGLPPDAREQIEAARKNPKKRLGKFLLLDELGRGGMGVVFRAWQEDLERVVALKILTINDPESRKRFLREARVNSKLKHPNIVSVHELGDENERAFFTMDFVEGAPLDQMFRRKRPPVQYVVELIRKVAEALHSAHKQGVIHRDIKPGNILVGEDGEPFLSDFGLARDVGSELKLTHSGQIMGTPTYMSPEQAKGKQREVDARSDVWSMGVVLYEALTGKTPFVGENVYGLLNQIVKSIPVRPSRVVHGIPRDLETIVMKCLEKDPERRYATAEALARDLDRFLSGKTIQARPVSGAARAVRWMKARPALVGSMVAAVPILLLVVFLLSRGSSLQDRISQLERKLTEAQSPEQKEKLKAELAKLTGKTVPEPPKKAPDKKPEKEPEREPDKEPEKPPPIRTAWFDAKSKVDGLLSRREFRKALETLDAFRPETDEERNLVKVTRERIDRSAMMAWSDLEDRIDELLEQGKVEDARRIMGPPLTWGFEKVTSLVKDKAVEIDRAVAEGKRREIEAGFPAFRSSVLSLCREGKFGEAKKRLDAKMKEWPILEESLAGLAWIVDEAARVPGAFRKGAEALKGEVIDIPKTGRCRILGGDDRQLRILVIQYKAETTRNYSDLGEALIGRLAKAGGASAEGRGLYALFSGDLTGARSAWSDSDRKDELDRLASEFGSERLAAEASDALRELFDAAKKKNWRKCRKILAGRDRYAGVASWEEAAERINEIAAKSGGDIKPRSGLFAVEPKAKGKTLTWQYVFQEDAVLQDWWMSPFDFNNTRRALGMHVVDGRLDVRSAEALFKAKLEGDQVLSADITFDREDKKGEGHIDLLLGGFRWAVLYGYQSRLTLADGATIKPASAPPELTPGRKVRAEMIIARGSLECRINGRRVFQVAVKEPPKPTHPAIRCWRDTRISVHAVTLRGTLSEEWKAKHLREEEQLGHVGKKYRLAPAIEISDGTSLGEFIIEEHGRWEVQDGALKAVPSPSSQKCQIDYDDHKFRAYRLRFKYRFHRGCHFQLRVRGGDFSPQWVPPSDKSDEWREIEVVSLPDVARAVVDGKYPLAGRGRTRELNTMRMLRIFLQEFTTISVKDVVLEPILGAPDEGPVQCRFYKDQVGLTRLQKTGAWQALAGGLRGTGSITSTDRHVDFDLILRMAYGEKTKPSVRVRGVPVFEEKFAEAADGKKRTWVIRCRGKQVHLLDQSMKPIASMDVKKEFKPWELRVEGERLFLESVFFRQLR